MKHSFKPGDKVICFTSQYKLIDDWDKPLHVISVSKDGRYIGIKCQHDDVDIASGTKPNFDASIFKLKE